MENVEKQIKQEQRINEVLIIKIYFLNFIKLKEYNEFLQQKKQEKLDRQNQYRDLLLKQVQKIISLHKKKFLSLKIIALKKLIQIV